MRKNTNNLAGADSFEPIRLTSDFVFKYVFGSETSTNILRSFLTAVQTDAGLPAVAEVEIRNPFTPAESYDAKTSVVDVRARDVNGTIYTVEVQALPEAAFRERALYYWAQAYAGQLGKGQDYEQLSPVVGVNVVDFKIFPDSQPVHTTFHLTAGGGGADCERAESLVLTSHLAIHFLELPKLRGDATPTGGLPHISTTLQRWLYYMRGRGEVDAMEDNVLLQILKEDPDIEDAEERYRQFVADEELREKYQDRIKAERDRRSQIIYAERQGEERGLEQGAARKQNEIAGRMKAKGMSNDEIAELTGLSVEEIDTITG
ncbi:MAG: Rpn family recombination-promoting nuclease/putative transposase [Spirochaeta sp.]|jgi:predicted transposase/invertase (TIGR01784 family)|nr:Rpn family recombination-promoting nuclease/putative transposase [Spirochaeta sp.]